MSSSGKRGDAPAGAREDFREALICGLLVAAVFAVYWPVRHFDFINLDDDAYVTANPIVQAGLSWKSIKWAFTTTAVVNWHPLTWLSHLLDCTLFDLHAGAHHVVNVLLHAAASILLFLALRGATGALWRSALVAAWFAVHPLHVESVAWVAERKDVLSGLFWMLALLAYGHYVKRPGVGRYLLVTVAFTAGLMAKPMVVTLPCVLLLLDYWPFRRFEPDAVSGSCVRKLRDTALHRNGERTSPDMRTDAPGRRIRLLFLEKLPWFALSAASGLITWVIQHQGGATRASEVFGLQTRLANALVSYVQYLGKTIYPHGLIVPYPHPGADLPLWDVAGAAAVLLGISGMAVVLVRRCPYLFVGWFWFLGTLVPVIGIIQVGNQAMADRYTYIPLIGLFIIVAWGAAEWVGKRARGGQASVQDGPVISSEADHESVIASWGPLGKRVFVERNRSLFVSFRAPLWRWPRSFVFKDLRKVFLRSGAKQSPKPVNAGISRRQVGRLLRSARNDTTVGVALARNDRVAGLVLIAATIALTVCAGFQVQHWRNSITLFEHTLRVSPANTIAHNNLGTALMDQGRYDEAATHFSRALEIAPGNLDALNNLGVTTLLAAKPAEAAAIFIQVLRITPNDPTVYNNLGVAYLNMGEQEKARHVLLRALEIDPQCDKARQVLGMLPPVP